MTSGHGVVRRVRSTIFFHQPFGIRRGTCELEDLGREVLVERFVAAATPNGLRLHCPRRYKYKLRGRIRRRESGIGRIDAQVKSYGQGDRIALHPIHRCPDELNAPTDPKVRLA